MPALRDLWRRGQRGWPSRFVLVQFPNTPLLAALAASAVAGLTEGGAHDAARVVSTAALAVWAALEVVGGVNWVRRLLGASVLVYLVVTRVA